MFPLLCRWQGLAALEPGKVLSWGQEGQEHGSPQGAGCSRAGVPLAQLKSSFIRQFPKQGLFTRESHPQRVGGTEMGGCPSLFSVPVLPKCPPPSSVPIPPQYPHSFPNSPFRPSIIILPKSLHPSKCPCPSSVSSSFSSILMLPNCPSPAQALLSTLCPCLFLGLLTP